ncbi:MAG: T9SS type A sorting domain-containing protein [candidate division Zixibacteria bacterium]|nr:T9SS type A sorting domain-containing protein [candidate division Zixibacteria bacterium]
MRKVIYLTTFVFLLISISIAFARTTYIGYSGAPGSRGNCASSCHGSSGGSIEIEGFPMDYIPGEQYTIEVFHVGGSSIRQFNGSCRIGTGSETAGEIEAGTNTTIYSLTAEPNGIHFSRSSQSGGTFLWTAPDAGTGQVKLYIAGQQGTISGPNTDLILVSDEAATSVPDEAIPEHFAGIVNYPNPFNARTNIHFELLENSDIRIDIYNSLGQYIETLIDTRLDAGLHNITWNASESPSGVYFYKVTSGDESFTRKMNLIK